MSVWLLRLHLRPMFTSVRLGRPAVLSSGPKPVITLIGRTWRLETTYLLHLQIADTASYLKLRDGFIKVITTQLHDMM